MENERDLEEKLDRLNLKGKSIKDDTVILNSNIFHDGVHFLPSFREKYMKKENRNE